MGFRVIPVKKVITAQTTQQYGGRLSFNEYAFSLFGQYLRISAFIHENQEVISHQARYTAPLKQILPYFFLFLFVVLGAHGQSANNSPVRATFQDSVVSVLEATRNTDAKVVAGSFASAWSRLSLDQQQRIKGQAMLMKSKKYGARPQFLNFYGSIVYAVDQEQLDAATFASYLNVVDEVIENEEVGKAGVFFRNARRFFELHSLHKDRSYELRALDDTYHFEYKKGQYQLNKHPQDLLNFDIKDLQ